MRRRNAVKNGTTNAIIPHSLVILITNKMSDKNTSNIPLILLIIYMVEAVLLGISPVDRSVWWAENLTAWIPIAVIVFMYGRGIRFSNTA